MRVSRQLAWDTDLQLRCRLDGSNLLEHPLLTGTSSVILCDKLAVKCFRRSARGHMSRTPAKIDLTPEEDELLKTIDFDLSQSDWEARTACLEAAGALTESLLKRGAIPEIRRRYLTDAELNIGGHGKSRIQGFTAHGLEHSQIFRHGNFLKYLRYFIYGPDLPGAIVEGFTKIIDDDAGTSGEVLDQLCRFTRAEVRRRLPTERYKLPEEFFRLALEKDVDLHVARCVRDSARKA